MKKHLMVLLIICSATPLFAQSDLYCNQGTCTSSDGHGYVVTCNSKGDEFWCNDNRDDDRYNEWRKQTIASFKKPGMTDKQAEEAFDAAYNAEPASVLQARKELCAKGILKADRCDFSAPHPLNYKVPSNKTPLEPEVPPAEVDAAIEAGTASKCVINVLPNGADIYLDDVKIGVSPLPLLILKKHDQPRKLVVKKLGYRDQELQISPDGTLKVFGVELEPSQGG